METTRPHETTTPLDLVTFRHERAASLMLPLGRNAYTVIRSFRTSKNRTAVEAARTFADLRGYTVGALRRWS